MSVIFDLDAKQWADLRRRMHGEMVSVSNDLLRNYKGHLGIYGSVSDLIILLTHVCEVIGSDSAEAMVHVRYLADTVKWEPAPGSNGVVWFLPNVRVRGGN